MASTLYTSKDLSFCHVTNMSTFFLFKLVKSIEKILYLDDVFRHYLDNKKSSFLPPSEIHFLTDLACMEITAEMMNLSQLKILNLQISKNLLMFCSQSAEGFINLPSPRYLILTTMESFKSASQFFLTFHRGNIISWIYLYE